MSLTPKLLLNHNFSLIEEFSKAIGWNFDFRQIDAGPLDAKITVIGHESIRIMAFGLNRSFHQIGSPPAGFMTFGFADEACEALTWNGVKTPPGVLTNFNFETKLDCVSPAPFTGFLLSFKPQVLNAAAKRTGLKTGFVTDLESKRFWHPSGAKGQQLRQILRALELAALEDGGKNLNLWNKVFNIELANAFLQVLTTDHFAPQRESPDFQSSAMNHALNILKDYNQNPVNVEALCRLVGVSWATLQRAFTREFGVSPNKYIKVRRLSAVQAELIRVGPSAVISDIANHWEFWHMGSFAADYRKQFGELPSETLRRLK